MATLLVKLLHPDAKLPVVAHPGEDLGFDLFTLEDVRLFINEPTKVRTGIAMTFKSRLPWRKYGLILKERSSLASNGLSLGGGVIDAGYTDEVKVIVKDDGRQYPTGRFIAAGTKIAQAVPVRVRTGKVKHVASLVGGARGLNGFGSTGK